MRKAKRQSNRMSKYCYYCGAELSGQRKTFCSAKCREKSKSAKTPGRSRTMPRPKVSIAEMSRQAKEAGMTYGKYVSSFARCEKMES